MHILVTGGAGYIGSTTAAHFMQAGHRVTIYDNLSRGHRAAIPEGAEFIRGDIGDHGALSVLFQSHKFDAVAHFAAFIEAGESMEKPGKYFRNNVVNSQALLDAMNDNGVKRLVFSSTAAVYASKNATLNEEDPLGPSNVYGHTKLMIEEMIHWYARQAGLKYAALRYFNACGSMVDSTGKSIRGEAHQPETHLIPLTLQVPLGQRSEIKIYGDDYPTQDGTCIRDYVHVEDLASAHVLALEAIDERGEMTYNLGNGRGYSVKEVIDVARKVTGHEIPAQVVDRRPGDGAVLVASSERINDELGWQPRRPTLEAIIETAWAWHQAHPHGYAEGDGNA
ncbi:MAG: UDP-glucose 4-epimerase [Chloroflexota bacterium]|nr:UDP-glucose 4-epimerase GalE [Chloroflexota bacterium]NOG65129.1 UDP-glucose 4-epimerase GalE [Chloroflexota bacterium]GIK63717.1 MAG: UDP-glucose 4-epimerase [Chloroflexota bacterium]